MRVGFEWCEAGRCTHPECVTLRGGQLKPVEFASNFARILHPNEGVILYDTGYAEAFLRETARFPERLYALVTPVTFAPSESAAARLVREGFTPADVKWIVISHFHADHVAGLRDFPNARFLCDRRAFDRLRSRSRLSNLREGVLPKLLPPDFAERLVDVNGCQRVSLPKAWAPFDSAYDLFGDHSLLAVPLEGHAEGQLGLIFKTELGRDVFLVADAVWHSESLRSLRMPSPLVRVMTRDYRAYHQTAARLHALKINHPDALLIPTHCREFPEGAY